MQLEITFLEKILQSRKLNEISIYAREGGQNTKNQPLDDNKPVNVEVKLIELTGNSLKEYLKIFNGIN